MNVAAGIDGLASSGEHRAREHLRHALVGVELFYRHLMPRNESRAPCDLRPVLNLDLSRRRNVFISGSGVSRHPTEITTGKRDLGGDTLIVDAHHDDHERRHGDDHEGVDERPEQGDDRLGDGLLRLRGRVGDRCRALARLIGEESSIDPPDHGHHDGAHPGSGHTGRGIERLAEDRHERGDHVPDVHENDEQGGQYVDAGHQGGQDTRDAPNASDASQNHRGYDRDQDHTGDDGGDAERGLRRVGHGVRLNGVPREEGRESKHGREEHGHPFPVRSESVLDVIHGSARDGAHNLLRASVHRAVMHGKGDLGILGGHSQDCGQPHPDQRTGTSPVNGQRDARNVADTDGR